MRILISSFALISLAAVALAAWLWLSARPVLDEAQATYLSLPSEARCEGSGGNPPGYPVSAREIERNDAAQLAVYRAACEATGLTDTCFYMSGARRWVGFQAYRRLYLSDCELRAASLHGDTPLHHSLELLYPDRPVASLGEDELTCVAAAMRTSHRGFCRRHPSCCATTVEE
jgi:hypothetical protein